ncbi:MAG: leucine-rich repeat domain-containing protein, partial [Huintestinicola sp.]
PSTLNSIGSNAFSNCGQLKEITVPDNVSTIGYAAFSNCTKLEKIDLPAELKSIGSSMFDKCYALKTVKIPGKVASIGSMAFNSCTALTAVEIPDSVAGIGTNAFYSCGSLNHIHIPCGKTASDYSGQGGLPANSEYYFILDSNGNCPNGNCPMDTSSTVEVIMGVTVNSDKVVVKYGSGNSVTRTVSYSFDQVSEDIVDYMADTDIQLIIEFVNAFTDVDNDCFELTAAQLMAVERVLSNDYAA